MSRFLAPLPRVAAASLAASLLCGVPARGADPLAAGEEIRAAVLGEISPFAEWQVGGGTIAFGRTEVRRVGDFAHVRAVVTRADGTPIDPGPLVWIREAARPLTLSGVLRQRAGRWLLLDAAVERADTDDPDAAYRRWTLPAGVLPPECRHRQNWGCGNPAQ